MANHTSPAEREQIVAKYDSGREEGAVVKDWENPDLSIYKSTDRYGFMHKTPVQDVLPEKIVQLERERALKWSKMVANWAKYNGTEQLYRRVNKGIPNSIRGEVWKHVLEIDKVKHSEIFEGMRELGRRTSPDIRQIDLDVLRTFRDHIMFCERYGIKQQSLFHVLVAYSMYNPSLGYCQGMSSTAAVLLMYLNEEVGPLCVEEDAMEEDAFWAMVVMIGTPKFAMHGLLIPGLPKLVAYCQQHGQIRQRLLPKLDRHLQTEHVDPQEYCPPWFVKCYLDAVPFQLALRVWDAMMFEGERVILALSIVMLKMHQKILLRYKEDNIRIFLQEMSKHAFNEDEVIAELRSTLDDLVKVNMDQLPPVVELQSLEELNLQAMEKIEQDRRQKAMEKNEQEMRSQTMERAVGASNGVGYVSEATGFKQQQRTAPSPATGQQQQDSNNTQGRRRHNKPIPKTPPELSRLRLVQEDAARQRRDFPPNGDMRTGFHNDLQAR